MPVATKIVPILPGSPVLLFALSGLGKSTLASEFPDVVFDADELLYEAVAEGFPELDPRARLQAWRELCRRPPWVEGGDSLALWGAVRRTFTQRLVAMLCDGGYPVFLTSLLNPPWPVSAYYGVYRGEYLSHLRSAGRESDNCQNEAMNDRLEGYAPLTRLEPGSFLGERLEIRQLLRDIAG